MPDSNWSRRQLILSGVAGVSLSIAGCGSNDGETAPRTDTDGTPTATRSTDGEPASPNSNTATSTPENGDDTGTDTPGNGEPDGEGAASEPTVTVDLSTDRDQAPVSLVAEAAFAGPGGTTADTFEWTVDSVERRGRRIGYGFETAGEYDVELTVRTDDGQTLTASDTVDVDPWANARPTAGEFDPEFAAFDATLARFIDEYEFSAAGVAVVRDGEVVLDRSYGWMDEDRTVPIERGARFRVGSLSKQFTAVAVESLIDEGQIEREDGYLDVVDLDPPGGELGDERWTDVTVGNLLDHRSGLHDRAGDDNPAFEHMRIVEELGLDDPPTADDIARFTLGLELEWDPDFRTQYSNLGYVLLGVLIEQVTGERYQSHVSAELLDPVGIEGVALARSRPVERAPGTVWPDPRFWGEIEYCPDVLELSDDDEVLCTRGHNYPAVAATAGHVTPPRALARFADEYGLPGQPEYGFGPTGPNVPEGRYGGGGMHGGFAEAFDTEGLSVAVAYNRVGAPGPDSEPGLNLLTVIPMSVNRHRRTR